MSFPSIIPCWRNTCSGDSFYEKTIISPSGREKLVYSCIECQYRVEIVPEELAEYCEDMAETTGGLREVLANALARVSFDVDGVLRISQDFRISSATI